MTLFDPLISSLKGRIPPLKFVRIMVAVCGAWMVVTYPLLHWFYKEKLPPSWQMQGGDFGQYYIGALAAHHHLWNSLYPTPNDDVYNAAPVFKPLIASRLFDSSPTANLNRKGHWNFYPGIALPSSSQVAPEILALSPNLQGECHYIYPPPLAILLSPLAFFNYPTATRIWLLLMSSSLFGIGYFSSRICRLLFQRPTYTEGVAALLPAIPMLLGSKISTTLEIGNISPFLGFLIALTSYAWLRKRETVIAFSTIPLIVFKGIGLSWCPLFLLKPIKWKTLIVMGVLTILLNGAVLYQAGTAPYHTFFTEILPKANIPSGISLPALFFNLFGVDAAKFFSLVNWTLIGCIYWGYWKNSRIANSQSSIIVASIAGIMAVFCLCNRVVWPHHYFTCYLMLPFLGWILWEGSQASGKWQKAIYGMLLLSTLFWIDELVLVKDSWLVETMRHAGVYSQRVEFVRHAISGLVSTLLPAVEFVFFLSLSFRRLFFLHSEPTPPPPGSAECPAARPTAKYRR